MKTPNDVITQLIALIDEEREANPGPPPLMPPLKEYPPPEIKYTDLPFSYPIYRGGPYIQSDASTWTGTLNFDIETLLRPLSKEVLTSTGLSQATKEVTEIISILLPFLLNHIRLATNGGVALPNSANPVAIVSEGVVIPLIAHDRVRYVGTRTRIAVPDTIRVSRNL